MSTPAMHADAIVTVERRCFDFKRANTEIGLAGGVWSPTQAGWEATAEAEADAGPTAPPSPGGYVPFGDDLGGAEESLADVAADLGRLNLKQHAANRGSEGRVAPKEPRVRGGEPEGVSGVCSQPCQYGGGGIVHGGVGVTSKCFATEGDLSLRSTFISLIRPRSSRPSRLTLTTQKSGVMTRTPACTVVTILNSAARQYAITASATRRPLG